LSRRIESGVALVADRRHVLEVADLARGLDHPPHRAADDEQLAPGRVGGQHRGLHARDVRGEGGEHHPLRWP
jgi:hypothetical protein